MSEQIIAQKGLRSNQQLIMKYPLGIEALGSFRLIFQKIQNKPMKTMVYLFARARKGFGMSALNGNSRQVEHNGIVWLNRWYSEVLENVAFDVKSWSIELYLALSDQDYIDFAFQFTSGCG